MERVRYLVCYDISEPKRLRRTARILEEYGCRLQFSVFECLLDRQRLAELRSQLREVLHYEEDQILLVSLGQAVRDASLVIEALGLPYAERTRMTII